MGFLDKAKAAAEQAAAKAKEGVEEVQTKRELSQTYQELGKATFALADSGELSHSGLTALVDKIRTLRAQVEEEREPAMAGTTTSSEQPPSDQPPAMPS
jgi:hypothetical protein